jgi:hypothetical protein
MASWNEHPSSKLDRLVEILTHHLDASPEPKRVLRWTEGGVLIPSGSEDTFLKTPSVPKFLIYVFFTHWLPWIKAVCRYLLCRLFSIP